MRLLSLALTTSLLTGCIATQGFAARSTRLSPRKEGAALLGIGAAQLLFGAAITYAAIYGKSKPEPSDSVTEGLENGAKEVGGRFLGAIFGGLLALGGAGDFLGGLVQTTTGDYFVDPNAEEARRQRLDLLRRTPINTTGNSDLDEPPRPPKHLVTVPISIPSPANSGAGL